MEEITVDSWEACKSELSKIEKYRKDIGASHPLLFRGQANNKWELKTTLEKFPFDDRRLVFYHEKVLKAQNQIESLKNKEWVVPSLEEYSKMLSNIRPWDFTDLFAFEFLIYLRHYGFPSPLLDWSRSPYIAAFFAFQFSQPDATHVSLYVNLSAATKPRETYSDKPSIWRLNPNIKAHKRHWIQQSQYTVCTCVDPQTAQHIYGCHQDVFPKKKGGIIVLWKINTPSSEYKEILEDLDKMNINPFTLFGSEEGMIQTIGVREFLFNN